MSNLAQLFEAALAAEGVSGQLADVARSIYLQESGGGRNTKTSNAGARGGMQIIPSTFASVADRDWDINNPEHNARAGIRYVKQLDKLAQGDPALIAAGYYGGPGALAKARRGEAVSDPRNPNAPNTLQYAQQVVGRLPARAAEVAAPQVMAQAPAPEPVPAQEAPKAQPVPEPVPAPAVAWQKFQEQVPVRQAIAQNEAPAFNFGPGIQVPDFLASVAQSRPVRLANLQAFQDWMGRA